MDLAVDGSAVTAPQPTFEDGLGERRYAVSAGNELLEVLRLNTSLSAVSSFEFALRERASRVASFRHDAFARVRAVELDRLTSALVVVSDCVPGVRLSTLIRFTERQGLSMGLDASRCLIRQLVRAVCAWREAFPDISHGAIGPERMIVTPEGRLVIADYVLGSALEQLRYSQSRYWKELTVALPSTSALPAFDTRTDATQIGMVALALVLGRHLTADEYPDEIRDIIDSAAVRSAEGDFQPLSADLRVWLLRALQLDGQRSFASARDARTTLDRALSEENPVAELAALRILMSLHSTRAAGNGAPTPSGETAPASSLDSTEVRAPQEVDLAPRIEALKTFLARYPGRRPAETSPGAATATSTVDPAPTPSPTVPAATVPTPPPAPRVTQQLHIEPPPYPGFPKENRPSPKLDVPLHEEEPAAPGVPQVEVKAVPVPLAWLRRWRIHIAAAVVIAAGVVAGALWFFPGAGAATGALTVDTSPAGIVVFVDGVTRGVTPLTIDLPPGDHVMELAVPGQERRQVPVSITSGGRVSQFFELSAAAPALGELQVRTDPTRVAVTVDGQPAGTSPVTVTDLTPGVHTVVLTPDTGPSVTEQVLIENGRTASLVVSMGRQPTASTGGWISIQAPADVQIYEGDRLLGTSGMDRIMMPVGRHELRIVNDELGYREQRTVQVSAGQVAPVRLTWPQGSLALNAIPWAEAWIDGRRIGETPIGNVPVPIGVHEVVFRHPNLGERRSFVTVKAGESAKVGVDLRAK